MKPFTVHIGGALLAGGRAGAGDPVVMLHAGVADRRMWGDAMAHLARSHDAICHDRRGFGETASPDEDFSQVDDLAAVLDDLGCACAHLIGCSQGGRIAIDFALAHPGRVRSLILSGSALSGAPPPADHPPEIARLLAALEAAEADGDPGRFNAIEAHLWLDGPTSAEGRVGGAARALFLDMNGKALRHPPLSRERAGPDPIDRLRTIAVPALVIHGDLDFPHVQARSRAIASAIPGARSVVMPGTAHLPMMEGPDAFNDAVSSFLGVGR